MTRYLKAFRIDKDKPDQDIKTLMNVVTRWKSKPVIETIGEGYLNKLFKCYPKEDPTNAIVVRVRDLSEHMELFQNELEFKLMLQMSKFEHFPAVYAKFQNGYSYQFAEGQLIIDPKKYIGHISDDMLRKIAKELVFVHCIKVPEVEYTEDGTLQKIEHGFATAETIPDLLPSREVLVKEMKFLANHFMKFNSPIVSCHGDVHPGNMIWNEEEGKITFIDWEMCNVGYQAFDIAYFIFTTIFLEFMGDTTAEPSSPKKITKPEDFENTFARLYYSEWCSVQTINQTEENFQHFMTTVHHFALVIQIQLLMYSVIFPDVFQALSGNVDGFRSSTIAKYLELKEELIGRKTFETIDA